MKQTRPYIITALCLQMVLGAILLSCSTENDEYKKDSPSAANPVGNGLQRSRNGS